MLGLDLFAAVEKSFDRSGSYGLFVKHVKHRFDRSDDDMQRYAAFLPRLDQGPVKRAQKEILAPTADKCFFDLCKVIVIVQKGFRKAYENAS